MSGSNNPEPTQSGRQDQRFTLRTLERDARLWSGLILMIFATTHFLNHALGVFGLDLMSEVQAWRSAFWQSRPGTVLLYGAAAVHVLLAMKRVMQRRTIRMPWSDAIQIMLGMLIPFLLIGHVVGARVLPAYAEADHGYLRVLRALWPANAVTQSLLLLIVWTHGVTGLYYVFHTRRWFPKLAPYLAALAALVPALSLAGFVAAGREAAASTAPRIELTERQIALLSDVGMYATSTIATFFALVALVIAFRAIRTRLGQQIRVRYFGNGEVSAPVGGTLLEISRCAHIPHPSACGGRGRCSSCRILVLEGEASLEPPGVVEKRMLERIRAPRHIRLACQIRPTADLSVRVLLGDQQTASVPEAVNDALDWGVTEELTVLCVDVRGFATLAEHQMPSDVFALLSRVTGEMAQAVRARGGHISMVQTDGIVAVFGRGKQVRAGSRAALNAAADLLRAIHFLNKDISSTLPLPVRIGIGVHSGPVMMSRADDSYGGQRLVVVGEAVVIANRFEEVTKELAADCVVSAKTIALAGLTPPAAGERAIHYKNGKSPVMAFAFADRQELRALLRRSGGSEAVEEAASPHPAA